MKSKVTLRAGTPDDNNRTYLPEAIKGSDIVVNDVTSSSTKTAITPSLIRRG